MTLAIAMPAWSDTLLLRDGRVLSGNSIAANRSTISFQDRSGRRVRYSVSDVEAVQFGDGPYNSGKYGRPENPGRENPAYGDNQDNRIDSFRARDDMPGRWLNSHIPVSGPRCLWFR